MKFSFLNTRSIVILGYCILVTLALTGIVTIYYEVIKSHRQSKDDSSLKKELIDLSSTLNTMYQAEGTANLLVYADNENFKHEYDSLTYRVFDQINSLRIISINQNISLSLDTLSIQLWKKRNNTMEMIQLIKQIDKTIVEEFTKRTIINRNDIAKLNSILAEVIHFSEDTVKIVSEKKSFFRKLQDVVKTNVHDTLNQITKSSVAERKDLLTPIVSDTIVDFIKRLDRNKQQKNAKIFRQLIAFQNELYSINELTGLQINKIMDNLVDREYQTNLEHLKDKNESLKRSTIIVAIVGLSALVVVVFFMSWTLHSLNKAQRLQKSIQEAKKQAEKLLKSREQLIYTITHDIKAPLSSIIGFLDLMSEENLPQKHQYYTNNMHSSASHIMDLICNLLDFHSIEKDQHKISNTAFLPAALIRNIFDSFIPLAQKKKIKIELNSTLDETEAFVSDPYYISQIVNNLLSNAIKYTQEHGNVFLITSIEKQNTWKIAVQDNGPGIALADQAKIFEEFIRLDKHKKEAEGTGLGLTISKKFATLLKGNIDIKSQKGAGSTFTLTIPLSPVVEQQSFHTKNIIADSDGILLFVDDDHAQLNLISELMKSQGLSHICCSTVYEALEVFKKQSFDLIFTDINISDTKGFDLVKRIKSSNPSVPVIAFSGSSSLTESEFIAAGFDGFLQKPCHAYQLMDVIAKYISFNRKINDIKPETSSGYGWEELMEFVSNDKEAAVKIIDSFIEETNENKKQLRIAFLNKNNEEIKNISHKMLSLMQIINIQDVISILRDFERGNITMEKKLSLFRLLDESLTKAKEIRKKAA